MDDLQIIRRARNRSWISGCGYGPFLFEKGTPEIQSLKHGWRVLHESGDAHVKLTGTTDPFA